MTDVLAADIGGTNIRIALVTRQGAIADEQRVHIALGDRSISEEQLVARLTQSFRDALKVYPNVKSIGAGFPGFFQGESGLLVASPNLPNLHDVALATRLSENLNLPVMVQNDALCAAIGEARFGAGKNVTNLLHITLGTGIGGGLILNNRPYTGETGMAMEFGHLRIEQGEQARLCGCGGRGCVEAYASATAISTRYAEVTEEDLAAKTIFERANNGDEQAQAIFKSAGHYLGAAIAEAIKLLDVHTVTMSGGLVGAWSMLHPAIMVSLNENLIPPLKDTVQVLPSSLEDNAGVLGAAALIEASNLTGDTSENDS